jgi:hypothetical protein
MTHAFANALKGTDLPLQGAGQCRIKGDAFGFEILTQAHGLPVAQRAQHIVVIRTKRGLAMAH